MKSNGITLASSPQRGSVEITYDELEVSNARRFVALYIDADAPEYDGDLDGGKLPEDILAAAIAFNRALQVLHFVPERSIVWLVDNVPGVTDETVRQYAGQALGMERVGESIRPAKDPITVDDLPHAMEKAPLNDVVLAIHERFDESDLAKIVENLRTTLEDSGWYDRAAA